MLHHQHQLFPTRPLERQSPSFFEGRQTTMMFYFEAFHRSNRRGKIIYLLLNKKNDGPQHAFGIRYSCAASVALRVAITCSPEAIFYNRLPVITSVKDLKRYMLQTYVTVATWYKHTITLILPCSTTTTSHFLQRPLSASPPPPGGRVEPPVGDRLRCGHAGRRVLLQDPSASLMRPRTSLPPINQSINAGDQPILVVSESIEAALDME